MKPSRVSKDNRNSTPSSQAEQLVLSAYLHSTKNPAFREFVRATLNSEQTGKRTGLSKAMAGI